jgi:hypothetical protein
MAPSTAPTENPDNKPQQPPDQALTQEQLEQLSDPEKQAEFWKAFIAQERRRSCPSCGEDGPF